MANDSFGATKISFREQQVREEMQMLLKKLASPAEPGDSVKACIRRASMRSGLPFSQTFRAWYGLWKTIPAHIADHLREKAAAHEKRLQRAMFESVLAMQKANPALYAESIRELSHLLLPDGDVGGDKSSGD